ncbi:MAG: hypothetical protein JOY62_06330 [Acidobacteriaceae bacterium]|nr:hypothetical protein [Acidobacteriaceae bacterium]MBV9779575.1 hypothetical protein [Acidobacteriaceae bacterium]
MKRYRSCLSIACSSLVFAIASAAQNQPDPLLAETASAAITTQDWSRGWDNFGEPLNLTKSNIKWSVSSSRDLTITFDLVSARANKLYQVSINFFCSKFPASFGQFPTDGGAGACQALTRQGVTKDSAEVELGVVRTDIHGNGSLTVVVGPIAPGTYELEFFARDGGGCNVNGGCGVATCAVDFQSPGPFGKATRISVP